MTDACVAMDARDGVAVGARAGHELVHHRLVAAQTVVLQDLAVARLDADRLLEVLQREALRVMPAIARLGGVLGEHGVWEMAVDARRDAVMARLLPAVVLRAHDVAVRARLRIGAEVRQALGVVKGEADEPEHRAGDDREHHGHEPAPPRRYRGAACGGWLRHRRAATQAPCPRTLANGRAIARKPCGNAGGATQILREMACICAKRAGGSWLTSCEENTY